MSFLNPVTAFKKTIKLDPLASSIMKKAKKKPAAAPPVAARPSATDGGNGLLAGTRYLSKP